MQNGQRRRARHRDTTQTTLLDMRTAAHKKHVPKINSCAWLCSVRIASSSICTQMVYLKNMTAEMSKQTTKQPHVNEIVAARQSSLLKTSEKKHNVKRTHPSNTGSHGNQGNIRFLTDKTRRGTEEMDEPLGDLASVACSGSRGGGYRQTNLQLCSLPASGMSLM